MNHELISVILPTYKRCQILNKAVDSVINQTYKNWELIIIDNNSNDGTEELIKNYYNNKIFFLKINNFGSIAKSRNYGIKKSRGKYLAFLDSDDYWTKNKLEICLNFINDKVDLIYHDLEIIGQKKSFFKNNILNSRKLNKPIFDDLLFNGNAINLSSVIVRKNLLEQIDGMKETLEIATCEDYNTWLRVAKLTEKFFYLPKTLGYYLIHNQNISNHDMSIPLSFAIEEFLPLLSEKEKKILSANLQFISGKFSYLLGDYLEAKKKLIGCLSFCNFKTKLKILFIIIKIYLIFFFNLKK
jgi:glycosyltransferase involved in cell wall biosynthesis